MINIGMELEGDKAFAALLSQIEQLSTRFAGVQLLGKRKDLVDSQIIVDVLTDDDRDFFSPDSAVSESVATAAALEIEKRLQAAFDKGRPDPSDDTLAAAALKAAMASYMDAVVERIESQRTATGAAPRELTEAYAKQKQRRFGFVTPIGKASGQLLESLTGKGGTAGKIELIPR